MSTPKQKSYSGRISPARSFATSITVRDGVVAAPPDVNVA